MQHLIHANQMRYEYIIHPNGAVVPMPADLSSQQKHPPTYRKTMWTQMEDELLREAVKQNGTQNWGIIAQHVQGRTRKQCRERWAGILNPSLQKDPWTAEEDEKLKLLHAQFGNRWALIHLQMPGRSAIMLKNRWGYILRHTRADAPLIANNNNIINQEAQKQQQQFMMTQIVRPQNQNQNSSNININNNNLINQTQQLQQQQNQTQQQQQQMLTQNMQQFGSNAIAQQQHAQNQGVVLAPFPPNYSIQDKTIGKKQEKPLRKFSFQKPFEKED